MLCKPVHITVYVYIDISKYHVEVHMVYIKMITQDSSLKAQHKL